MREDTLKKSNLYILLNLTLITFNIVLPSKFYQKFYILGLTNANTAQKLISADIS